MKKIGWIWLGFICLWAAKAYAYDDHDFQVWNTDVQEFRVSKDSKIALEEEFRWADNANEFYYHHYDAGFYYQLKKSLGVGGGYRHIYELKRGKFKLENEPYATISLAWSLKGFKFEDRSRMEYRQFDYQADSWRYRNKITVKLPLMFSRWEIQPFLSEEVFIGFAALDEFNQNRFSAGLGMSLLKNVKAEVYYLLQSSKSSDSWKDTNVLGTKFKITF